MHVIRLWIQLSSIKVNFIMLQIFPDLHLISRKSIKITISVDSLILACLSQVSVKIP